MASAITDVKEVLEVKSDVISQCPHCVSGAFTFVNPPDLAERVTHYLQKHGYRLLHVGQESDTDSDGNPYQRTIAVLGK